MLQWNADPGTIVRAVHAGVSGESLLPHDLVQSLVNDASGKIEESPLESMEIKWLRHLSEGRSISWVAQHTGYSQREMFRRLSSVYQRMGVDNKCQAIVRAAIWGLLDDPVGELTAITMP